MALQLGALRSALLDAGATPDKADKAAEELAGYESRLARIDALAAVGLLVASLVSQAALWIKLGEIGGQVAALNTRVERVLSQ